MGGALGSWIGMKMYRHKTKNMTFVVGVPALFFFNVVSVYYVAKFLL
ncbi:DUF1294 domain-containing protein [Paenibacillus abyssi]|nr:DUF1294 domain-containing protein [Paenibacillus abyssi]